MNPARFEIRRHYRGLARRWTWVLRAENGEVVATGEPYTSPAHARRGAADLAAVARRAVLPTSAGEYRARP